MVKAPDTPGSKVLRFPRRHRGDPDPRRCQLAALGFRWSEAKGVWQRRRTILRDEAIDELPEKAWQQRCKRWARGRQDSKL
jgi:hypothetical protein